MCCIGVSHVSGTGIDPLNSPSFGILHRHYTEVRQLALHRIVNPNTRQVVFFPCYPQIVLVVLTHESGQVKDDGLFLQHIGQELQGT